MIFTEVILRQSSTVASILLKTKKAAEFTRIAASPRALDTAAQQEGYRKM